ncbi:hypothetical protein [Brachyspira pilosicoli]|uniref:hypothetical protein n=1 Tax=Brachyspira pilosicoli TaxID=52584 RepID=UPI003007625C
MKNKNLISNSLSEQFKEANKTLPDISNIILQSINSDLLKSASCSISNAISNAMESHKKECLNVVNGFYEAFKQSEKLREKEYVKNIASLNSVNSLYEAFKQSEELREKEYKEMLDFSFNNTLYEAIKNAEELREKEYVKNIANLNVVNGFYEAFKQSEELREKEYEEMLDFSFDNTLYNAIKYAEKLNESNNDISNFETHINNYKKSEKRYLIKNKKKFYSFVNKVDEFKKIFNFYENNSIFYDEKDIVDVQNNIKKIILDEKVLNLLVRRLEEIKKTIQYKIPFAAIMLSGSALEGILLYAAYKFELNFKQSKLCPKNDNNRVKGFNNWTLNELIDVAYDIGLLTDDVKRLSHNLREFRNYIHPDKELKNNYSPNIKSAKIFVQILLLAISEILDKLSIQS